MFTKSEIALAPDTIKGLIKLGWKGWEPRQGEWVIDKFTKRPVLIFAIDKVLDKEAIYLATGNATQYNTYANRRTKLIPILHWEKIADILRGMGYQIVIKLHSTIGGWSILCRVWEGNIVLASEIGITSQLAVMQAVIKLREGKQ